MREAGIQAELRPDMEALLIYRPGARLPLWVFVGYGGASFSWQSGQKRHPVDDVGGAAAVLTAYLRGDDRTPAPR